MLNEVDALLDELNNLRIAEETIIARLFVARAREIGTSDNQGANPTSTTGNRPIRETRTFFREGQRVEITNRVVPIGRRYRIGDNTGEVIKITPKRVKIQTDTGLFLYRDPKNVRHLSTPLQ
jgi:hypothetical protein